MPVVASQRQVGECVEILLHVDAMRVYWLSGGAFFNGTLPHAAYANTVACSPTVREVLVVDRRHRMRERIKRSAKANVPLICRHVPTDR